MENEWTKEIDRLRKENEKLKKRLKIEEVKMKEMNKILNDMYRTKFK